MASKVEICNLALTRIGQRKIQALTEQSAQGVACADLYDLSRRAVLEMAPWRFAMKTGVMAVRDEDLTDYDYSFTVPADCIRVVLMNPSAAESSTPIQFEVFGEALWTNDPTGEIRYVWDIEDTAKFSPAFVSALAYYMAADLAPIVTGKMDMQSGMLNAFSVTLRAASGVSASQARQPNRTGLDIKNSRS